MVMNQVYTKKPIQYIMLIEVKTMKKIALLFVLCCMFFNTTTAFASTIYFSDVPHLHSAHSEINYLANNGVIRGTSADTFSPNNYVTNRQLAAMLVRALQLGNEAPRNPGLKDVSPFDSGYKEIAIAIQNGIFPKTSYFHPNAHATREGIARALTHAFQLKGNQQACHFPFVVFHKQQPYNTFQFHHCLFPC